MNRHFVTATYVVMFGFFMSMMCFEIEQHNWVFTLVNFGFALMYALFAWENIENA